MLDDSIQELESRSLARIAAARSPEELEAVRVEALGRKGTLAEIGKEHGQAAARRPRPASASCSIAPNKRLKARLEAQQPEFAGDALRARLDSEWVDLTLPAPGPRRGHLHPITQIQRELEELFISLGFTVLDGPEVEDRILQLRRLEHPAAIIRRATCRIPSGWMPAACCAPIRRRCRFAAWSGWVRRCA